MTKEKPNCLKCLNFINTYDPVMPYGCGIFGFQTVSMPSILVKKSLGRDCSFFGLRILKEAEPAARKLKDPEKKVDIEV